MFQPSAHCPAEARIFKFFDLSQPRESFSDKEIEEIKLLLPQCTHYSHASIAPRTFIVLRYIGQLQVLRRLLEGGFEDSWFPISKPASLPNFLDPRIKTAIFQSQHIIVTKSIDLEKGIHCSLSAADDLPFNRISYIGSGSYGQVCRIESKVTCKHYALKTIRRRAAYGPNSRQVMDAFIREMKIMKGLRHHHIVQYIGSYTDPKDLGLVMSPIADCDLAVYLRSHCTQPASYPTLRTFYGCLASALAYLHDQRIKHRDIKPSNILVYRASVLLTDFGLSHDSLDTTSGTNPGTFRYQSPEVAASDQRNAATDVWSLGCVFLEMLAALNGRNIDWLESYYKRIGTHATHFHANTFATIHLLTYWRTVIPQNYQEPILWIGDMLVEDRSVRPTAAYIAAEITASGDGTRFMYSCSACGDDFSDSDLMSATNDSPYLATPQGTNSRVRDTESVDGRKTRTAGKLKEKDDDIDRARLPIRGPKPSWQPLLEPELEAEPPSAVEVLHYQEAEEPQAVDRDADQRDTTGQGRVEESAPSLQQTPQGPTSPVDATATGCWQYLDRSSTPPTPKLDTRRPRTPSTKFETTSDNSTIVEAPSKQRWQQEQLTSIEPPPEPHHEDGAETDDRIFGKRRDPKSGGNWKPSASEGRPRSAAGESAKSKRRRSKDEEEAQGAQQHKQHGKKQYSTSNGLFRIPKKGFRGQIHGVKK